MRSWHAFRSPPDHDTVGLERKKMVMVHETEYNAEDERGQSLPNQVWDKYGEEREERIDGVVILFAARKPDCWYLEAIAPRLVKEACLPE